MQITQSWEGTDYLTISELTVFDQNGSYENVPDWNLDWSFEKKTRKCGSMGEIERLQMLLEQ